MPRGIPPGFLDVHDRVPVPGGGGRAGACLLIPPTLRDVPPLFSWWMRITTSGRAYLARRSAIELHEVADLLQRPGLVHPERVSGPTITTSILWAVSWRAIARATPRART